jgi:hypothetical protein
LSDHPLCCDCDLCIGPGVRLGYAPIVHKTLGRPTSTLKGKERFVSFGPGGTTWAPALVLRAAYVKAVQRRWESGKKIVGKRHGAGTVTSPESDSASVSNIAEHADILCQYTTADRRLQLAGSVQPVRDRGVPRSLISRARERTVV